MFYTSQMEGIPKGTPEISEASQPRYMLSMSKTVLGSGLGNFRKDCSLGCSKHRN